MRRLAPTLLVIGVYFAVLALRVGQTSSSAAALSGAPQAGQAASSATAAKASTPSTPAAVHDAVVDKYCLVCHNDKRKTGGLTLEGFDVAAAERHPEIAEKIISKLRVGLMPPKRAPQPAMAARMGVIAALEAKLDAAA